MCEWSCATRIELCLCLSAPANWQQPQQQQQSLTTTPSSDNNNFIKMSASKGQNFCCPSTELPEQPQKPPPVVAPPRPTASPLQLLLLQLSPHLFISFEKQIFAHILKAVPAAVPLSILFLFTVSHCRSYFAHLFWCGIECKTQI